MPIVTAAAFDFALVDSFFFKSAEEAVLVVVFTAFPVDTAVFADAATLSARERSPVVLPVVFKIEVLELSFTPMQLLYNGIGNDVHCGYDETKDEIAFMPCR